MGSHLYNSCFGKLTWFIRRFGVWELFRKPLRILFAPWIISRLPKAEFQFDGRRFPLFYHRHNMTWANERAVEIPIARSLLDQYRNREILEVGNVMAHYFPIHHTVIDKYETGAKIINEDIIGFTTNDKFSLILSVSTFEHIGFDDESDGHSGKKIRDAVACCRRLLDVHGRLVVTVPLGYNADLDRMVADNNLDCKRTLFLQRTGPLAWRETDRDTVLDNQYGRPFPYANALMVAEFSAVSE